MRIPKLGLTIPATLFFFTADDCFAAVADSR